MTTGDSTTVDTAGTLAGEQNPFLRYRARLDSYQAVRDGALTDDEFAALVNRFDAAVEQVGGVGFRITPMIDGAEVIADRSIDARLDIKIDVGNVAGSHKARHLFGVALHLLVAEATGQAPLPARLAIASCGNAALGAATVARALDRPIDVFVPVWADEPVVAALDQLGASITRCERRAGEIGDPCYLRFREAVDGGARAFSVQGTDTPTTFDGGRTLGWEIEEQVGAPDVLYVQVGGGALATALGMALPSSRLHPVQAAGCAPLARAWERLAPTFDFDAAAADPERFMTAWDAPASLASGILDDITYDWLPLLRQTRAGGGHPIVAPEATIVSAWDLARGATDVPVCATGAAGLAGILHEPPAAGEHAVLVFTGIDRS